MLSKDKVCNYFKSKIFVIIFIEKNLCLKYFPGTSLKNDDDDVVGRSENSTLRKKVNVGINSNRVEMEKVLHYRKNLNIWNKVAV